MSRAVFCTVGIGGIYPQLIARMLRAFRTYAPSYEVSAWVNAWPHGTPSLFDQSYDYSPYAAKIFALEDVRRRGADIGVLIDAAFFPIRDVLPLIQHIESHGYYLCANGFKVGEWSSDRCIEAMGVSREDAFTIEEASSYCVGLDFRDPRALELLYHWQRSALDPRTIPGPHSSPDWARPDGRNVGFVSADRRVRGHRHDQTVLSILAHRLGMKKLSERPYLTAYAQGYGGLFPTDQTVLVNDGRLHHYGHTP